MIKCSAERFLFKIVHDNNFVFWNVFNYCGSFVEKWLLNLLGCSLGGDHAMAVTQETLHTDNSWSPWKESWGLGNSWEDCVVWRVGGGLLWEEERNSPESCRGRFCEELNITQTVLMEWGGGGFTWSSRAIFQEAQELPDEQEEEDEEVWAWKEVLWALLHEGCIGDNPQSDDNTDSRRCVWNSHWWECNSIHPLDPAPCCSCLSRHQIPALQFFSPPTSPCNASHARLLHFRPPVGESNVWMLPCSSSFRIQWLGPSSWHAKMRVCLDIFFNKMWGRMWTFDVPPARCSATF